MGIRVFHCDDSEAFTRLVAFWLAEHPDIEHAGRAHTAGAALAALPGARPDVVLLDTMGVPGDDSLLRRIRAAVPGAAVIVYSGYVPLMRDGALGDGADAYLPKSDDEGELVAAIRRVAGASSFSRAGGLGEPLLGRRRSLRAGRGDRVCSLCARRRGNRPEPHTRLMHQFRVWESRRV